MKVKSIVGPAALVGFALALCPACDSSNVELQPAPAVTPPAPKPVPSDIKQGGGKGSSGNRNKNPGADS